MLKNESELKITLKAMMKKLTKRLIILKVCIELPAKKDTIIGCFKDLDNHIREIIWFVDRSEATKKDFRQSHILLSVIDDVRNFLRYIDNDANYESCLDSSSVIMEHLQKATLKSN